MPSLVIDHPALGPLLDYWDQKRRGRAMPERRDIDPLEMGARLLPHLLLCDLTERGARVRFRLVGTNVVRHWGFDPTGQHLEDQPHGSYFTLLAALHRASYCERAPVYSESTFRWDRGRRLQVRHLVLPLSNGGAEPAISLMGEVFESAEAFPPQIRALNDTAAHSEGYRAVLSLPAVADGRRIAGASVA
jgi:hypothetical protein